MHILIVAEAYFPVPTSHARMVADLAHELKRQHHEVTVIVPRVDHLKPFEVTMQNGIRVALVRSARTKGVPKLLRGLRELQYSWLMWHRASQFFHGMSCDLIIFFSPPIFFTGLVRKLKRLYGCPAYLVLRDIFSQFMANVEVVRERGWVYRLLASVERRQYDCADVIGVQSPGDVQYFAENYAHKPWRVELLYNWYAPDGTLPRSKSGYRNKLGLDGKVVFFCGGNFGIAQDVDNILRLAKDVSDAPDIFFLLVGHGTEVERIQAVIAGENRQNIRFLPAVSQEEYLAMLAEFDVGLVSLDRRFKFNNIPGKLMAYLWHSMPVLASVNPGNDLKEIVNKNEAGFCCTNGESELLREYALALANSASLRKRLGRNGHALLHRYFSVSRAVDQIVSHCRARPETVTPSALKLPASNYGA
jgi:glycosyltransferase involved in cell wall biosynthesis